VWRPSVKSTSSDADGGCQGSIEFTRFGWLESADKVSECGLSYANQFVAVNGTWVLETFFDSNRHLGR
jgi:hypothetical protein